MYDQLIYLLVILRTGIFMHACALIPHNFVSFLQASVNVKSYCAGFANEPRLVLLACNFNFLRAVTGQLYQSSITLKRVVCRVHLVPCHNSDLVLSPVLDT
jgi:hypothetical protein